jgi:predicted membrane protein
MAYLFSLVLIFINSFSKIHLICIISQRSSSLPRRLLSSEYYIITLLTFLICLVFLTRLSVPYCLCVSTWATEGFFQSDEYPLQSPAQPRQNLQNCYVLNNLHISKCPWYYNKGNLINIVNNARYDIRAVSLNFHFSGIVITKIVQKTNIYLPTDTT